MNLLPFSLQQPRRGSPKPLAFVKYVTLFHQKCANSISDFQVEASVSAALALTGGLEKAYLVKKKSIEMLPDAANNLAKLQGFCASRAKQIMNLAAEWESHRKPLVDAQRTLKEGLSMRKVAEHLQHAG